MTKKGFDGAMLRSTDELGAFVAARYRQGSLCPVFSDNGKYVILPGLCDVHVHLREPGFSYKETVATGSSACAAGGYSTVCSMPNLRPVPDSVENLKVQLDIIRQSSVINVLPYGAITVGELGETPADMEGMAPYVCGFSDDGKGVQSPEMMKQAMLTAKKLGKVIAAHCEDNSLLRGGYIHDGAYAAAHGHPGICSESEWEPIVRDIELARQTGVKYHVCHISCKESVDAIRRAKAEGVDITCETAPHYLILSDSDLREEGRFKMNPPLRSEADRLALIEGLRDGTIDMIATDHAPHSEDEKSRGLSGSPFGIVGIETAFALMYTHLVRPGIIDMDRLCELMCVSPRRRFDIAYDGSWSVFELGTPYTIDPNEFLSLGRATPFAGERVYGRCILNVIGGKAVWQRNTQEN